MVTVSGKKGSFESLTVDGKNITTEIKNLSDGIKNLRSKYENHIHVYNSPKIEKLNLGAFGLSLDVWRMGGRKFIFKPDEGWRVAPMEAWEWVGVMENKTNKPI